ncbi:MAG: hypothetical protein MJ229_06810 [bacterium]|nr:hypothetical protein [bacterium]
MNFLNALSSLSGNTSYFSNMTPQSSGLSAETISKIQKMETLTNLSSSTTSCFIGLNAPVMTGISSASYVHQMAAILNEATNSVFESSKNSYTSTPVASTTPKYTNATAETKAPAKKETQEKSKEETDKMINACSDAFAKRHASDKAEQKEAHKNELINLVQSLTDKKHSGTQAAGYYLNYANNRIAELEKLFTEDELKEIYDQIAQDAKPKYEGDEKLPENKGQDAAKKQLAKQARAKRIENPAEGSKLAILRAQLKTVSELEKTHTATAGYLPNKSVIEKQIREIETGETEAILTLQIEKLEEETKDYGETRWYNFSKNAKLRELEELKERKANLF